MKKIYYLQKHPIKIGDVIEYNSFRITVTEELIGLNPELFLVKDTMQELLDKAKRDYPIGTMFNSKHGMQEVLSDEPFIGISIPGTIQINTDRFPGGATIYTPEDGWSEILPFKFITEDRIPIYGDMKTYLVRLNNDNANIDSSLRSWDGGLDKKYYKYFYHKENALDYIKKCKEKILEDYENILFERDNSMISSSGSIYLSVYGWLKDNEPKLYYTKILQLIADDLHDGRYIHETRQSSFRINKEGRVTLHMVSDEGSVYFKSKELAEKARAILGDNVKYLFK